jgi:hypothetical protein
MRDAMKRAARVLFTACAVLSVVTALLIVETCDAAGWMYRRDQ